MAVETPEAQRALEVTLDRMRRYRAHRHHFVNGTVQFEPANQPVFSSEGSSSSASKDPIEHHDVLVLPPGEVLASDQMFRFPVNKVSQPASAPKSEKPEAPSAGVAAGTYDSMPEVLDAYDFSQRSVLNVADPRAALETKSNEPRRGPAFATLPVKPEPAATSLGMCYLIDAKNINFRNAWTAEEWIDTPGGVNLPPAPGVGDERFEVILAGPQGKAFRLVVEGLTDWTPGEPNSNGARAKHTLECINLASQVEIWSQLRNGCVAGRVLHRFRTGGTDAVVPLVNITALTPRKE